MMSESCLSSNVYFPRMSEYTPFILDQCRSVLRLFHTKLSLHLHVIVIYIPTFPQKYTKKTIV